MAKQLRNIIERARGYAIEEKWDKIDKEIVPKIIKDYKHSEVVEYLPYLFEDKNGNVRDLAGTIVAELEIAELPEERRQEVKRLLKSSLKDSHPYARFRATVAAVKHGLYDLEDKETVLETLENVYKTETDEDIKKIAHTYLKKLKNK